MLRETLNKIRSAPTPASEEVAKIQMVLPILSALGWDTSDWQQVRYEYAVGGKGGGKVDIALDGTQDIVALIEAKSPGQDLKKHVDQVIQYAFHEGVDICVLTTGLEWWLYLPREKGPPEKRLFLTLEIREDRIEQLTDDLTTFLGKKNLLDGQASGRAKQVLKARHLADRMNTELPRVWESMLSRPDDDLIELVRQRAYEKLNLRPDRQQVAAVLGGSPVPTVVSPDPGKPKRKPDPPEPAPKPAQQGKPAQIRLLGEHRKVSSWRQVLIAVAEELQRQHTDDFDRVLSLHGTKRQHASRNPDDLRSPAAIGRSGIYLETHWSAKNIQRRVGDLLELFEHPPTTVTILYD